MAVQGCWIMNMNVHFELILPHTPGKPYPSAMELSVSFEDDPPLSSFLRATESLY